MEKENFDIQINIMFDILFGLLIKLIKSTFELKKKHSMDSDHSKAPIFGFTFCESNK